MWINLLLDKREAAGKKREDELEDKLQKSESSVKDIFTPKYFIIIWSYLMSKFLQRDTDTSKEQIKALTDQLARQR